MKKVVMVLLTLLLSLNLAAAEEQAPLSIRVDKDEAAIVEGGNRFALDLYGRLGGKEGNLFFSPSSIHTALAMTYAGARAGTAEQMAKVMRYGKGDAFFTAYGRVIRNTRPGSEGKFELDVANALWLQEDKPFLRPFLDINTKYFHAGLFDVDFQTNFEAVRKRINKWVEEKTKDKIKNLLAKGSLNAMTQMVLTNAIYFKGDWLHSFKKRSTHDAKFHVSPGREIDVRMMTQTGRFGYLETDQLQALRMPYKGEELSMVVLLPRKKDGLAAMEKSLTMRNLFDWIEKVRKEQKIKVFLPKFRMDYLISLGKNLAEMGMMDAFTSKADFSGMTGSRDLFISAVIHKAYVDVDEKGTEAAAATAVVLEKAPPMPRTKPLPVFRADHPFIFLIRHEKTGAILFLGRVAKL